MFAILELMFIGTAIIGFIGGVLQLVSLVIARRFTPTHIYIGYTTLLWLLAQFFSPTFHDVYTRDLSGEFNISDILTLLCIILLFGGIVIFVLLFFMDYFPWIGARKIIVIITHAGLLILTGFLCHFIAGLSWAAPYIIIAIVMTWLTFLIIILLRMDISCLVRRRQPDSESKLRHCFVLTFMVSKIVGLMLFVLENMLAVMLIGWPSFGYFTIGMCQLDPMVLLIVLLKVDDQIWYKLVEYFKKCNCYRSGKVEFQNLPSDNGSLLNQDV